jgi:hypothetical protein
MENVERLADWLQELGRSTGALERPLQSLLDACAACRTSKEGPAKKIEAMRNALDDCVAAAAIAADQDNLGPDLSDPANAGRLNELVRRYAVPLRERQHAMDRIVCVVGAFLKDPTARGNALGRKLRIDVTAVGTMRSELRNRVACNIPENRLVDLASAALRTNKVDAYARNCSQLLGDRLVNPKALPLWKEMVRRYIEKSGESVHQFLQLVSRRDASLLQFIPAEDELAGVLYAHLFKTNRLYCKPIEDARDDLLHVLAAAGLGPEPGEAAAAQQSIQGAPASDPQADA